ncbi:hypothetical protein HYT33_01150 [Candidatus Roizmanbacteria bacterium]|nr:hypothetical protein [Candidatus Roizmanbacteria bacterium]
MEVIPAILPKTKEELDAQLKALSPFFSSFHIDIADGEFVPNKTADIKDLISTIQQYNHIAIDFHLMVFDYNREFPKIRSIGQLAPVKHVIVHFKLFPEKEIFEEGNYPFVVGVALNPDEEVKTLATNYELKTIPFVQIMSVNPGFQGSSFIKETLNKVEQLRLLDYRNKIFLDGGINEKTIPLILSEQYHPDILCVGSYLTRTENISERVTRLQTLLKTP